MKNYTFHNLHRVNKTIAKTYFTAGKDVIFTPCNCRPVNDVFGLAMPMNKCNQNCDGQSFDSIVNAFEYYNCNAETGKYTAFYVED